MATPQLYLIRHGIAADLETFGRDEQRPLTAQGRSKTHQVAKRLHSLNLFFDPLLTSPLVRARETAEILKLAGLGHSLEESTDLAPGGSFDHWLIWLKAWQHSSRSAVALVGHQPDLSQWAERLVWGKVKSALELKKAGIIGIALPTVGSPVGNSQLFWLAPPRLLL